mgnify:CR=1 FL=1
MNVFLYHAADREGAMLADVAQQVQWHGQTLTAAEWKDLFTAAVRRQRVVPGLDGGVVVIGALGLAVNASRERNGYLEEAERIERTRPTGLQPLDDRRGRGAGHP